VRLRADGLLYRHRLPQIPWRRARMDDCPWSGRRYDPALDKMVAYTTPTPERPNDRD
jgi:hypothetical protein